jgi:iron complex transport system permease protein
VTPTVLRLGDRVAVPVDRRAAAVTAGLLLATVGLALWALTTGDVPLPAGRVVASLVGLGDPGSDFIVRTLRLPRVLTGVLVGAGLGVSGAIVQTLTRNPLGSPDFVGITSGASAGALLVILVLGGSAVPVGVGAVAGTLVTGLAIYLLALRDGAVPVLRLVLMGIGVSAMLEALSSFLVVRARLDEAVEAQRWLVGSLAGRGWEHVWPVLAGVVVLVPVACAHGRALSLLALGEEIAALQGVAVARARAVLLVAALLLAALAVAAAGPVAFVALAAPQLAVRLTRSAGPGLLPAAAMGALLLVASDQLAQRLPGPLPVGVVTGAVGGAYLVGLLATEFRRTRI